METVGPILALIALVVIAVLVVIGIYMFLEAIYSALKAVPSIWRELTKIREYLEKEGFTLVELLVIIVLVGVLSLIVTSILTV